VGVFAIISRFGERARLTMLVNYSTPRPCVSSRKIPSGRHSSVARRRIPTLTARTTCRLPSATVLKWVECCEGLSGFCIYAFACVFGRGNARRDQFWNEITTIMNNVLAFIAVHISMKEGILLNSAGRFIRMMVRGRKWLLYG
jgi:hypothetical protein